MRCQTLRGTLGLGDALVQVLSTRALGRMEQAGTIPRERRPLAHAQGLRLNTPFFPHPSPARSLIPEVMDSHCLQKGSELLAGGSPTGGGHTSGFAVNPSKSVNSSPLPFLHVSDGCEDPRSALRDKQVNGRSASAAEVTAKGCPLSAACRGQHLLRGIRGAHSPGRAWDGADGRVTKPVPLPMGGDGRPRGMEASRAE